MRPLRPQEAEKKEEVETKEAEVAPAADAKDKEAAEPAAAETKEVEDGKSPQVRRSLALVVPLPRAGEHARPARHAPAPPRAARPRTDPPHPHTPPATRARSPTRRGSRCILLPPHLQEMTPAEMIDLAKRKQLTLRQIMTFFRRMQTAGQKFDFFEAIIKFAPQDQPYADVLALYQRLALNSSKLLKKKDELKLKMDEITKAYDEVAAEHVAVEHLRVSATATGYGVVAKDRVAKEAAATLKAALEAAAADKAQALGALAQAHATEIAAQTQRRTEAQRSAEAEAAAERETAEADLLRSRQEDERMRIAISSLLSQAQQLQASRAANLSRVTRRAPLAEL